MRVELAQDSRLAGHDRWTCCMAAVEAISKSYTGPAAWQAADMRVSQEWIHELSPTESSELEAAAEACASIPLTDLGRADFPLPTLGPRLLALQADVVRGRGFVLIRGVPVDASREMAARIYMGIGTWFGDPVPQNAAGHLLGHVKDLGKDPANPVNRIYQTRYRQLFHTDSCDVVGLLCLQPAKTGGQSAIASSTSVYNEMAKRCPDLAAVLARPFVIDRKEEIPPGKEPTYEMPIFHHADGHLTTIYARDFIEAAQRFPDAPRLTDEQNEAMLRFESIAASDEMRLDMDFRPGDIQFLHNHQILHARTDYEDYPEPERKRHLLRLWLSTPNGRQLPDVFAERYGEIRLGARRGGIRVPGAALSAPLDVA